MLVRELAARYLADGGTILIDADPAVVKDLDRAGPVATFDDAAQPSPGDVVVLSVDSGADADALAERLGRVSEPGAVVLLLLPVPVTELPTGRLAQAGVSAGLAFVEMAPIEPGWAVRAVVVCRPSRSPVPVRPYLGDDSAPVADDIDGQSVRLAWEWGLGDARSRALELRSAQQLTELRAEVAALEERLRQCTKELEESRAATVQAQKWAASEAERRTALQQSPSFLVGRAVLTTRHHPLQGARQLAGAVRRSVGRRGSLR